VLTRGLHVSLRVRTMVILGFLSVGFILFLLTTSNPFLRQFDATTTTGRDLNPLLQDIGFLFHPPMLYMGYVGFSVAFALALAVLWQGRDEHEWAQWARPWTLAAWCCLTLGITLGSWWAYRELGWGGWWFWDPVENASFMPWLAGTALVHALVANQRTHQFKSWTLLLAIVTFSLSLVGAFLVRSGVLISVHAFAVDPLRGAYILVFLTIIIGSALLLYALRSVRFAPMNGVHWLSRESALGFNSMLLAVIMLTVLLGTVYPLLIDGLGLGKLSVGAPYFNTVFVALMIPLLMVMGSAVHLRWRHDTGQRVFSRLVGVMVCCILAPLLVFFQAKQPQLLSVYGGVMLGLWVSLSTLLALIKKIQRSGFFPVPLAYWGMVVAHVGVAVTVIGIAVSSGFGVQHDVKLIPGEAVMLANTKVTFVSESALNGPNYHGTQARFALKRGEVERVIFPQKRVYDVGHVAMTDAAIDVSFARDIYVALGEPLDDSAWSVRLYYKPLVRWIWAGGVLMMLGGLFAIIDGVYRMHLVARKQGALS